ncbi:MAG: hypothetical protein KatS3mg063_1967 [Tepidiforma sp.]|uniref:Uncharacterized protein n=1 Tax=Tepidiforma bonchosmolovskayae TaxID=2601677 RepID=A0ABX6C1A1_9CHLR|nr:MULTISPECIES: hypothetical protein [Tepidiforma]QFG02463.1 hypothetical protein Tbon_03865 [Tepidiforma bonchosmolovskayae]GIW16114.1 MAG: hypothetical protein KatS3mg063_1967 [Tepidiforma sp.]
MNRIASIVTAAVTTGLSVAVLGTVAASQGIIDVGGSSDDHEAVVSSTDASALSAEPAVYRGDDDRSGYAKQRKKDKEHEEHEHEEHEHDDD